MSNMSSRSSRRLEGTFGTSDIRSHNHALTVAVQKILSQTFNVAQSRRRNKRRSLTSAPKRSKI